MWWHERCSELGKKEIRQLVNRAWKCPGCKDRDKKEADEVKMGRSTTGQKHEEQGGRQAKRPRRQTQGSDTEVAGAAENKCYCCGVKIRAGAKFLRCQCGSICHRQEQCSRRTRATQDDPGWKCEKCGPEKSSREEHVMGRKVVGLAQTIRQQQETEQQQEKTPCVECGEATRKSSTRLICNICRKEAHKKEACSRAGRNEVEAMIHADGWSCSGCSRKMNPPLMPVEQQGTTGKERKSKQYCRKQVVILQWNADDVRAKMPELKNRLKEENVDICVVQESKLRVGMKTPTIPGYTTVRKDRGSERRGGGLLTFIKEDIQFEEVQVQQNSDATSIESQCIRITSKSMGQINIMNSYCPPFRRQGEDERADGDPFRAANMPRGPRTIYLSDLNAHSDLWDCNQRTDARGEEIEQWLMEDNLMCLNNGTPTRVNRGTGGMSCPDTSFIPSAWASRMEWTVGEDLGSDHLPICMKMTVDADTMEDAPPRTTWSWKRANWEAYAAKVDELLEGIAESASISIRAKKLAEAMIKAAEEHIGQVTIRRKIMDWMTPELLEAIKERNRRRQNISMDRQAWIEQCRKVSDLTRASKEEAWRRYLEKVSDQADASQTWKVIKSLSGTPQTNGRNEVLKHNGKTYGTARKKASIFMQHYAKVSRLKFSKRERDLNREAKKRLRVMGAEQESSREFTISELRIAMAQMRDNSAAGEDKVAPRMIKNLSDSALKFTLALINDSWVSGFSPQDWRCAIIIPLLKINKPASKLDSYRPVSLTSCLAKTMERMVANRLHHLAETNGWWCEEQAGFRGGRCTEDQIVRISQNISDGFQRKPMERSVLALLDYSKAYDTVWREKLLINMLDKGVPLRYVRWIKGFLRNRMASVKVDNQMGKKYRLRQGLPQGAVLSPLLFLFFIDPMREALQTQQAKIKVSMYADDVAVWSSSSVKEEAAQRVQEAVNCIADWSDRNKLVINAGKSEVSFFSTDVQEAKWKPNLKVGEDEVKYGEKPVFLGITFDRTLSFKPQAEKVAAKAKKRGNVLAACAGQDWGWKKEELTMAFKGNVQSVLDYGAAGWHPWLADSNMDLLERAQNAALRRVTGQIKSTPVEALRMEAGVESYKTKSNRLVLKAYEKARRMPEDNPRARAATDRVVHRTKRRSSWRQRAEQLGEICEKSYAGFKDHKRQKLETKGRPPWDWESEEHWIGATQLQEHTNKDAPDAELKKNAQETVRACGTEITIYTDGSAKEGWIDGGSAAVITRGPPEEPLVEKVMKCKGRRWTSSFETEAKAMMLALHHLVEQGTKDATICTDSQALVAALKHRNKKECTDVKELRIKLAEMAKLPGKLRIQWVPGHCGLEGNERADREANAAAAGEGAGEMPDEEISWAAVKSVIKKALKDKETDHPLLKQTYTVKPQRPPKSRSEAVLLAQLRSGHHFKLQACNAIISGGDPTCPRCGLAPETLTHWLQECPALSSKRRQIFGTDAPELSVCTTDMDGVTKFVKETLTRDSTVDLAAPPTEGT